MPKSFNIYLIEHELFSANSIKKKAMVEKLRDKMLFPRKTTKHNLQLKMLKDVPWYFFS